MTKTRLVVCVVCVALFGCGSDSKETADAAPSGADAGADKTFTVSLTKAGEPTPCTQAGANATGSATVTVSGDGSKITVTNMMFSGLSGAAISAHIHFGTTATPSGPVVLPFPANPTSPVPTTTFTAANYSGGSGAPADFATFVSMTRAGNNAYLNVHTDACKGGEIRGELQ